MARLHLDGPMHAWCDTAFAARLGEGGQARAVMAFLGPDGAQPDGVGWIGRRAPGVLTLTEIVPHGTRHAWVYPRIDALGVARLVDVEETSRVPLKVAAELVASVADTLHQLGADGHEHPGPSPDDIGLDADGNAWVLGFSSPWPRLPVQRDPSMGTPSEALVWRLGVLLAMLLAGTIPAVSDRAAHDAMVRRVLIRAMSRSGPMFSERYRDWVTAMLHWDPDRRPPLSSVGAGLRELASQLGGAGLAEWSAQQVPARRRMVEMAGDVQAATRDDADPSYHPWQDTGEHTEETGGSVGTTTSSMNPTRTLPGLDLSKLEEDEHTAESTLLAVGGKAGRPRLEPGTMPVGVGPPAEEARHRAPRLPQGFLDEPASRGEADPRPAALIAQIALLVVLGAMAAGMVVLGLLVLVVGR